VARFGDQDVVEPFTSEGANPVAKLTRATRSSSLRRLRQVSVVVFDDLDEQQSRPAQLNGFRGGATPRGA
jgi:hypothetical protein